MIDSHCHLADPAFRDDLDQVVARCREAGVGRALCVLAAGKDEEAAQADRLELLWPEVRFAIGVHPHSAGELAGREGEAAVLVRSQVEGRARARAIGEIGLDFHYDFAPRPAQHAVMGAQLRLALDMNLPVILHTREAESETLDVLDREGPGVRGVFHCFTGTAWLASQAVRRGFYVSFAGIVTFPTADALRQVARGLPADRLLIETDSPYLAPVPNRGKRNEPAWVARTLETLANVRGTTPAVLADQTTRNFHALFGE